MEFGAALGLMRAGRLVTREGWQGGPTAWLSLRTGYPEGIVVNDNTAQAFQVPDGATVRFAPYFQIMTYSGLVECWVPAHADLLASDWAEVTPS